jgi:hypothetical protein
MEVLKNYGGRNNPVLDTGKLDYRVAYGDPGLCNPGYGCEDMATEKG